MLYAALLGIALFFCGWGVAFVVSLYRAPRALDEQRTTQITALTTKIAALEPSARLKQTSIRFARLMEDGSNLESSIRITQDNQELSSTLAPQLGDWIKNVVAALTESDLLTDASAFLHSGERPTAEQTKAIAIANFVPDWKRYHMTQLILYRSKLQEIIERRGI
jgi:hypothetical protein